MQVIAITVEDEDDIAKFKDYKPSQPGASKEDKVSSDSTPATPPKKEAAEPVSLTEPKKSKVDDAPQSGSRIFASPLARKLAEDNNVSNFIGCDKNFLIPFVKWACRPICERVVFDLKCEISSIIH